ncbi:YifB family Mg chelatase-like AAA ATPase [Parvibium lacunae]|uniref:ATP-dependent protease n=1 Tax=Parvibium lacunae TaxID=1888893 RepID=A0A368L0K7_9BURK|nr:YifB family Mg chelatase-like AAA ATPase [Parvibium lacunae]RCS57100.1 ATP-dependent protease [Parvibium lacunae]
MPLAVLHSRAVLGVSALPVRVEVHLANGLPGFTLVGLPEAEVKESRDRVRAAIQTSGFEFPQRRITVNLAPADLPKESGHYDLPIALGILAASGQLILGQTGLAALNEYEFAGELSLSGELLGTRGALAFAAAMQASQDKRQFILAAANATEASLIQGLTILPATSLVAVVGHLSGQQPLTPTVRQTTPRHNHNGLDLKDIKGQNQAKRALEIAAAGGHSLLLVGPPGSGKSMLANRLPGLLPALSESAAQESAALLSLVGKFDPDSFGMRPFRAPHHTASAVALVGGGSHPRPGEISLAHQGILFLDELPEFDRRALEVLREPLENGRITISRAARQVEFPADFQLVAAMNPCPCGYFGQARCRCTPDQIQRYQHKLSGPLLDRIDMVCHVPSLTASELTQLPQGEASSVIAARVQQTQQAQRGRQSVLNARLTNAQLEALVPLEKASEAFVRQAIERLNLSARAYHRILKLARTIADLGNNPEVALPHLAEALQYRRGLNG